MQKHEYPNPRVMKSGFSVAIDGETFTYRHAINEQGRGILIQTFASGNEMEKRLCRK